MSLNAVNHRRVLHRMPELDDELPDTTAYVRKVLEPLGAEVFSPIKGSVCAYFDAGAFAALGQDGVHFTPQDHEEMARRAAAAVRALFE